MTTEICTMSTNQTEDASSLMTKIPPPPSEHPPPYTLILFLIFVNK